MYEYVTDAAGSISAGIEVQINLQQVDLWTQNTSTTTVRQSVVSNGGGAERDGKLIDASALLESESIRLFLTHCMTLEVMICLILTSLMWSKTLIYSPYEMAFNIVTL